MRDLFLLNPNVVFLNHGSFGACPTEVFDIYQNYQRELEWQPVEFLGRRSAARMDNARAILATYLNTSQENLIFVPNTTIGVNTIARSMKLNAGDEILSTDHEYGALDYTWDFICRQTGAVYIRQHISLPFDASTFTETIWSRVTPRTKVLYLSHITSSTALIFPIEALCRRAREHGIMTVIDGAHVPGQLPLNLEAIDADYYVGNCHKWMCAPKGAAFLYARPEHHVGLDALVISWGYSEDRGHELYTSLTPLAQRHQWQGTRDLAAFLSVPAAIDFQVKYRWDEVRQRCHALAIETQQRISELTGLAPVVSEQDFGQMVISSLPEKISDGIAFQRRLYDDFRIEIPITKWNGQHFIRVSFQGYNTQSDADALISALKVLL